MKELKKRGQVTIFIIIAVLIVAGVSLFFILKDTDTKKQEQIEINPEIEPVYSYVQNCLDSSSEDVVYTVGVGGGYYNVEEDMSTENLGVTYHLKDGESLMPSKKEIEKEISNNIEMETENCSSDLDSVFTDYQIKQKNVSVETTIEQEEVLIEADFPLLIKKEDSRHEVRKFREIIPIKLGLMHEAVSEFISGELGSSAEGMSVKKMTEVSSDYGLEFNLFQIDREGKEFIFMVTSENQEINNETFIYSFANRY